MWYAEQLLFALEPGRLAPALAAFGAMTIVVTTVLMPLCAIHLPETMLLNVLAFGGAGLV